MGDAQLMDAVPVPTCLGRSLRFISVGSCKHGIVCASFSKLIGNFDYRSIFPEINHVGCLVIHVFVRLAQVRRRGC